MNLTSRPHKSGERMRAAREKMTPRAPQIFLISSARPRTRSLRVPVTPSRPYPPFSSLCGTCSTRLHARIRITCLHSGLSRKSCSTGAFFFFSLLSGPLSLFLSFSTSLMRAPFPARSDPGFSPVTRTRVSYFLYNHFGARETRYSSTSNS